MEHLPGKCGSGLDLHCRSSQKQSMSPKTLHISNCNTSVARLTMFWTADFRLFGRHTGNGLLTPQMPMYTDCFHSFTFSLRYQIMKSIASKHSFYCFSPIQAYISKHFTRYSPVYGSFATVPASLIQCRAGPTSRF